MRFKRFINSFTLIFILLLSLTILINLIVDPYQIYHKNKFGFLSNERYQVSGLISSYLNDPDLHYDSIIVGTSMSQNFIPSNVAKTLKFNKTLKLTISGSTPVMKDTVLSYAIETGKVKSIMLEIFESYSDNVETSTNKLPLYLYKKNNLIKFKSYILNIDILKKSILLLLNLEKSEKDLDKYQYWMDKAKNLFLKFNECKSLLQFNDNKKNIKYTYTDNFPKLDTVIKIIKENPKINFILFFPPYSRLCYFEMNQTNLNKNLSMRRYLLNKLNNTKNVKIFAFDNMEFTTDLANYKDTGHYSADINNKIVYMISKDVGLLTPDNINNYESNFIKNLSNFKVYSSSNRYKKYQIKPVNYE